MMETGAKETCVLVPRAEVIARLNDAVRQSGTGGVIVVTAGVRALCGFRETELLSALAGYDRFDSDNDPHGERDFGDFELFGADLLWKLDYYDLELRYGSDDPANDDSTVRVLTIMLACEY